jgi:hypothetical protein
VRHDEAPDAGPAAVLAGLAGGEVPARALLLRRLERRLDHEQVGVARELDELVGRPVVGAVGDAATAGRGAQVQRVRVRQVVRDRVGADLQVADGELVPARVLLEGEGLLDELLAAPGADDAAQLVAAAARDHEPHRVLARPPVGGVDERVGERHEVEAVVRVHVRDDHGVDRRVVRGGAQLPEDAVADVHEERGGRLVDEVAAARPADVGERRALAEDPHAHVPQSIGSWRVRRCAPAHARRRVRQSRARAPARARVS